ncbi:MAG: short chain dehydrogenase [Candidatus Gracilibacteria bacterium]|nr:short chain dehydrogenase [Candidatus Gracilibacteria bacterium]
MKKVLVIGATGLIGKNIVKLLEGKFEIISASYSKGDYKVDISNPESIKQLFKKVGNVDYVICTAGVANFANWEESTDKEWDFSIKNKMMGQINIARYGEEYINKGGSIVLTSGLLAQNPMKGSFMVTVVNSAVEAFVRASEVEISEDIRINAVSPGWVKETMEAMGMESSSGIPAIEVAKIYVNQMENGKSGSIAIASK